MLLGRRFLFLLVASLASWQSFAFADDAAAQKASQIALAELPDPPKQLAELMERGSVTLHVGKRKSQPTSTDAAGQVQSKSLAAETFYQLGFNYRARTGWNVRYRGSRRMLTINVTYSQVDLTRSHEVWFKKRPATGSFWTGKLVLHEFDHVRLSSDPSIEQRFRQRVSDKTSITKEIGADLEVTDSYARKLVDEYVQSAFDDTLALVDIRYKELDRQTNHGIRPLPEDSSLAEWLR